MPFLDASTPLEPLDDDHTSAPAAAPAPALVVQDDPSKDYAAHLKALIDAGAERPQIDAYIKSQGIDPALVTGIDETIAYRKTHKDYGAKVGLIDSKRAEPDSTPLDIPQGGKLLPDDIPLEPLDDNTVLHRLGVLGRGVATGVGKLMDGVIGVTTGLGPLGMAPPVAEDAVNTLADNAGAGQITTPRDETLSKVGQGIGMAGPLGAEGGALGVAGAGLSGASSVLGAEGAKEAGLGPVAQLAAAALAGGVTGFATTPSTVSAITPELNDAQAAYQAAKRIGLDKHLLPATVGGPAIRNLTAVIAKSPIGVSAINRQAAGLTDAGESFVQGQAARLGEPAIGREAVGDAATTGALKYAETAKRAGHRMYDVAAAKAGDAKIALPKAAAVLDDQIARLEAVPGGGAGLADAKALRAALDSPYPVQGVRDMRTEMFVSPEFRNTPVEGRIKQVVNAASEDVVDGLRAQGKADAADAFSAADSNWRNLLGNLKANIEPIIGPLSKLKSGEAVAASLNSAMRNNGARLASFVNNLPGEQQGIVKASLLTPLGRNANGEFSLSRFHDDWGKIGETAKRAVFGQEGKAALDDLAMVGKQVKAAQSYVNFSNTGSVNAAIATGATVSHGIIPFVTAVLGQGAFGRLLASPKFARWLARAPKTTLTPPSYIERLDRIARSTPAIAPDVRGLQQQLANAFSQSPGRLAAQEDDGRPKPPYQQNANRPLQPPHSLGGN